MSKEQLLNQYKRELTEVKNQIKAFQTLEQRQVLHASELKINTIGLEVDPKFTIKVYLKIIEIQLEEYKKKKESLESAIVILSM